jgi:hypothetical protein
LSLESEAKGEEAFRNRTTIVVTKDIRAKLQLLKKELGFRNLSALFTFLILEQTKGGVIPPVLGDNRSDSGLCCGEH